MNKNILMCVMAAVGLVWGGLSLAMTPCVCLFSQNWSSQSSALVCNGGAGNKNGITISLWEYTNAQGQQEIVGYQISGAVTDNHIDPSFTAAQLTPQFAVTKITKYLNSQCQFLPQDWLYSEEQGGYISATGSFTCLYQYVDRLMIINPTMTMPNGGQCDNNDFPTLTKEMCAVCY